MTNVAAAATPGRKPRKKAATEAGQLKTIEGQVVPTQVEPMQQPAPAAAADTGRALAIIEKVIQDPGMPVERVTQAFDLYQRVMDDADARTRREAEVAYRKALPVMQGALPVIKKRGKGHNDVAYARWEDIAPEIQPILTEHGFGLQFFVKTEPSKVVLTARLSHQQGHYEDTEPFELPADTSGSKNAVQALGSSTSYAKRYIVGPLLNLTFEGEDDDGNGGSRGYIDDDQIETLRTLADETEANLPVMFKVARASSWETIPAAAYPRLRAMLLKKKAQLAGEGHVDADN